MLIDPKQIPKSPMIHGPNSSCRLTVLKTPLTELIAGTLVMLCTITGTPMAFF
jgi:hypothetical protein